jgi:GNAT superfamily N-acetyltransferase
VAIAATTTVDTAPTGTNRVTQRRLSLLQKALPAMNIELRAITPEQISLVVQIQIDAYAVHLQEDENAFQAKFQMHPQGFIGAFVDDVLAGYAISFPWYQDTAVSLNKDAILSDKEFDCYYMHDVAVLSQYRGFGIADKLVNSCLDAARSLGLYTVRMVTVQGGENIWARYGFEVYGVADDSYGPQAYKMTITLPH